METCETIGPLYALARQERNALQPVKFRPTANCSILMYTRFGSGIHLFEISALNAAVLGRIAFKGKRNQSPRRSNVALSGLLDWSGPFFNLSVH
jgi:hypothetical protein